MTQLQVVLTFQKLQNNLENYLEIKDHAAPSFKIIKIKNMPQSTVAIESWK